MRNLHHTILYLYVSVSYYTIIPLGQQLFPNDGLPDWDDEVRDKKVMCMQELVSSGNLFEKSIWDGGVASLNLVEPEPKLLWDTSQTHHQLQDEACIFRDT